MPLRVVYRPLGAAQGFAFDTPDGCTLVFDPTLTRRQQDALAAELLDPDEFTVFQSVLSACR